MELIRHIKNFILDKTIRFGYISNLGLLNWMGDKAYICLQYRSIFGRFPNIKSPISFNEKMQWLKIHNRNALYTDFVDKYEVRTIVERVLGESYLIPLLGVWDSPHDIDFEKLPKQFVLKCNHNSGLGMCICKNKNELDYRNTIKNLNRGLAQNYYLYSREWPYKNVKRRIIAEEFIKEDDSKELKDYKVFVFSGKAQFIQVDIDRFSNHRRNFYTTNWEYVAFTTCYPTSPETIIEKPKQLEELLSAAEKLSVAAGTPPFVRVDMYITNDKLLFGEMTFYHGAGCEMFYPQEYDIILGNMINISGVDNG